MQSRIIFVQPSTKRQNDIIQLTAERAADQPQFEVLLKVKQTGNPDFAFLRSESNLYPYYSWLKGRKGVMIVGDRAASRSSSSSSEREDGIGGLLAGYGSSSDEEDEEERKVSNDASEERKTAEGSEGDVASSTRNATSAESLEETNESSLEEKRAKRLKKAQELKAHFESKLAKDGM